MKKLYSFIIALFLMLSVSVLAQSTLSGTVEDAASGEKLIGANVYIKALNTGSTTNANGKYEIANVPKGTYEITVSYLGYLSKVEVVFVNADLLMNVQLKASPVLLQEAVVQSTRATLKRNSSCFYTDKGRRVRI